MAMNPVTGSVQQELGDVFRDAQQTGQIPKTASMRIMSFPVAGSRELDYKLVDDRNTPFRGVKSVRSSAPTICG